MGKVCISLVNCDKGLVSQYSDLDIFTEVLWLSILWLLNESMFMHSSKGCATFNTSTFPTIREKWIFNGDIESGMIVLHNV